MCGMFLKTFRIFEESFLGIRRVSPCSIERPALQLNIVLSGRNGPLDGLVSKSHGCITAVLCWF